jgi:hypothetical protein
MIITNIYAIYDDNYIRTPDLLPQLGLLKELTLCNSITQIYKESNDQNNELFTPINDDRKGAINLSWLSSNYELSNVSKSLCINHLECLKLASENNADEWSIIIEDDILLINRFAEIFNEIIDVLPNDCNVLFPTSGKWPLYYGLNEHTPLINLNRYEKYTHIIQNIKFEFIKISASRCSDFILIKNKAAKFIFNKMIEHKIALPIDWDYKDVLQSYWLTPAICQQNPKYFI